MAPTIYDRAQRVREWESLEIPFPFKGINPLLPQNRLPQGSAYVLENAEIHHLLLKKRWGTKTLGGAITGRIQRFGSFLDAGGSSLLFVLTTTQMASYAGAIWTTRKSGLGGISTLIPAYTSFQNKLIVTNGANIPYKWDGITPLGSDLTVAPVCRAITNLGGRVLLGNITSGGSHFGNRVQWSDFLNEDVWAGGTSGTADLIDTDDEIQSFSRMRDQIAILRKKSIWLATVAEAPLYYRFERAFEGLGCVAQGTVASVPGGVIFLGPDDLYVFNGASSVPLLPKDFSLRKLLEEQTNLDGLQRAVGWAVPSRGQYWLCVALGGGTENTHVLVFDFDQRTMVKHVLPWSGGGVAEAAEGTGVWSEFTDFWAAYDVTWAQMAALTSERVLGAKAANSQPLLYNSALNDEGGAIDLVYESPLLNMATDKARGTDMKMVHRVQVYGEPGTAAFTVELGYSFDGSAITWSTPFTVDTTQPDWIYDPSMPTEAPYWAVRLKSLGANAALRVASVILWYTVTSPQPVEIRAWTGERPQQ